MSIYLLSDISANFTVISSHFFDSSLSFSAAYDSFFCSSCSLILRHSRSNFTLSTLLIFFAILILSMIVSFSAAIMMTAFSSFVWLRVFTCHVTIPEILTSSLHRLYISITPSISTVLKGGKIRTVGSNCLSAFSIMGVSIRIKSAVWHASWGSSTLPHVCISN